MLQCTVCGSQKILRGDQQVCIFCPGKKPIKAKANYVQPIDPGEEGIRKILSGSKVAVAPTPIIGAAKVLSGGTASEALSIIRALPMPDDIKQFKKIKKIIMLLEDLIGETNAS